MGWIDKLNDRRIKRFPNDPVSTVFKLSHELNGVMDGPRTLEARARVRELTDQIISTGDKIPGRWRVAAKRAEGKITAHEQHLASHGRQLSDDRAKTLYEATVIKEVRELGLSRRDEQVALLYVRASIVRSQSDASETNLAGKVPNRATRTS